MEEREWVNSEMINLGTSRIMIVSDMLQEAGLKEKKNNGRKNFFKDLNT